MCDKMISLFSADEVATGIGPFLWVIPQSWARVGSNSVRDPCPTTFRGADREALLSCRSSHAWDRTRLCSVWRDDESRSLLIIPLLLLVLVDEKKADLLKRNAQRKSVWGAVETKRNVFLGSWETRRQWGGVDECLNF